MATGSARKKLIEARRAKVAAMLQNGFPQRQMAAALNVSVATINRDIKALVQEWQSAQSNSTDAALEIDLQRLDQMLVAVYARAKGGELAAVQSVLAILDRRRSIYGYAAPQKIDLTATGEPITLVEVVLSPEEALSEDGPPSDPAPTGD